ncbi:MAG: S8 family serine peptidase [Firmicutes bacterium]|nr:S8 family serine peptidase [Bacillota bacterium]
MKNIKSLMSSFVISTLVLSSLLLPQNFVLRANEIKNLWQNEKTETKVISKATIDEDFSPDHVIVTLNRETSRQFKTYTIKNFPELDLIGVEDLTSNTVDFVEQSYDKASKRFKDESTINRSVVIGGIITNSKVQVDVYEFRRILCLTIKDGSKEKVLEYIKVLEKRVDVLAAEPDYFLTQYATPNDPYFGSGDQWGLINIQAQSAWEIEVGKASTIVGVIDSGIDASHSDLTHNIHRNSPHTIYNTLHRDFTDDTVGGLSILEPTDATGHGTAVAGVIGANGNNGIGVTGVCWNIRLVSMQVFMSDGNGQRRWVIRAINYAASVGIEILNYSGGSRSTSEATALGIALDAYTGIFICAVGNDNNNNDSNYDYPSYFSSVNPRVISVGASDQNNKQSDWDNGNGWLTGKRSSYGQWSVSLFAPGSSILTTQNGNFYGYYNGHGNGTSFSAPFVAGVAALIKSKYPNLPSHLIKQSIMNGVDKFTTHPTIFNGWTGLGNLCASMGRLNAYKSLLEAQILWAQYSATPVFVGNYVIVNSNNVATAPTSASVDFGSWLGLDLTNHTVVVDFSYQCIFNYGLYTDYFMCTLSSNWQQLFTKHFEVRKVGNTIEFSFEKVWGMPPFLGPIFTSYVSITQVKII